MLGPGAPPDLLLAIRDARGKAFQRLEFLGDPLLETIEALDDVARHGDVPHHRRTTDEALASDASSLGVDEWLEWAPNAQRRADLVEALAGAAYLTTGWRQVGRIHERMHGRLTPTISSLLAQPPTTWPAPDPSSWEHDRARAALGASVLETAATLEVYTRSPESDEGELSTLRGLLHTTRHIAAWGESIGLPHVDGQWRATSDLVEAWVGGVALTAGPATAVQLSRDVLLNGQALGVTD